MLKMRSRGVHFARDHDPLICTRMLLFIATHWALLTAHRLHQPSLPLRSRFPLGKLESQPKVSEELTCNDPIRQDSQLVKEAAAADVSKAHLAALSGTALPRPRLPAPRAPPCAIHRGRRRLPGAQGGRAASLPRPFVCRGWEGGAVWLREAARARAGVGWGGVEGGAGAGRAAAPQRSGSLAN